MEEGRLSAELDDSFSKTQAMIESVMADGALNRGLRVRAKAWLAAMRMPVSMSTKRYFRPLHTLDPQHGANFRLGLTALLALAFPNEAV